MLAPPAPLPRSLPLPPHRRAPLLPLPLPLLYPQARLLLLLLCRPVPRLGPQALGWGSGRGPPRASRAPAADGRAAEGRQGVHERVCVCAMVREKVPIGRRAAVRRSQQRRLHKRGGPSTGWPARPTSSPSPRLAAGQRARGESGGGCEGANGIAHERRSRRRRRRMRRCGTQEASLPIALITEGASPPDTTAARSCEDGSRSCE